MPKAPETESAPFSLRSLVDRVRGKRAEQAQGIVDCYRELLSEAAVAPNPDRADDLVAVMTELGRDLEADLESDVALVQKMQRLEAIIATRAVREAERDCAREEHHIAQQWAKNQRDELEAAIEARLSETGRRDHIARAEAHQCFLAAQQLREAEKLWRSVCGHPEPARITKSDELDAIYRADPKKAAREAR